MILYYQKRANYQTIMERGEKLSISISQMLGRRRRIRRVTILSSLLLLFYLFSLAISKNPVGIKGINNGGSGTGVSATKHIYPVQRGNQTCALHTVGTSIIPVPVNPNDPACFNPYALEPNDIIQIGLSVVGANGYYTLTDEPLTVPGSKTDTGASYVCSPVATPAANPALATPGSVAPDNSNWNSQQLLWTTNQAEVYYRCQVKTCTLSGGLWTCS
jgi:hypothetical protein